MNATETNQGRTEAQLRAIADRVLAMVTGDAAQVTLHGHTTYLTRFANNQIHQNVGEQDLKVAVAVAFGRKVGRAATNDLSDAALAQAVADAEALAKLQPEDPAFVGFVGAQDLAPIPGAFVERTARFGPEARAKVVGPILARSHALGLTAAGSFQTSAKTVAIATSAGGWNHHVSTMATYNAVVMGTDASGWAADAAIDAGDIDGEALATIAIDKALRAAGPTAIEPGAYTVILEEEAVHEMLSQLARGFGAEEVHKGSSFLAGREGQQLLHPDVSIWDDPTSLAGAPRPFDDEGMPSRKVVLFDKGVAGGPVSDRRTAALLGTQSTGHHMDGGPFWSAGPAASHLFMAPGTSSKAEMLASTERGIWVTRFHYVNQLDPRRTTITGMTRDGTFWIEDGKIVKPLLNLRFTHEVLQALKDVVAIGRDTKLAPNWWGGANRVPALKIDGFRFTGKTTF